MVSIVELPESGVPQRVWPDLQDDAQVASATLQRVSGQLGLAAFQEVRLGKLVAQDERSRRDTRPSPPGLCGYNGQGGSCYAPIKNYSPCCFKRNNFPLRRYE